MHVLYSFPDGLGAPGIGTTARHQVEGLIAQGIDVTVWCTSLHCDLPGARRVVTTLQAFGVRVPHRALGGGDRAYRYHDACVARGLRRAAPAVDVVHVWPRASLRTARAARALGIRAVREAPNTHTGYAFDAVRRECELLGIAPPPGHSHTFDVRRLRHEQAEYDAVDVILCQSEFSRATFVERGVPAAKVAVHQNGTDISRFRADDAPRGAGRPLTALFAGRLEPRKGLHYALEAWARSGAGERGGRLVICGEFVPGYREVVAEGLELPGVELRGYVPDLSDVMRQSDVFLLPSVEEGSALVTYEAQACGCVLVVSDATGARCEHLETGLVHAARDVDVLAEHLRMLDRDPALLARLRAATIARLDELSWARSAEEQAGVYAAALAGDLGPTPA
jgi:glycosyltransferase involved in cell wall biosynthesis